MRSLAMVIMVFGVVLAAAGGSRNGADHVAHRLALMEVEQAPDEATKEQAEAALAAHPLPEPGERLAQWWQAGGPTFAFGMVLVLAGAGLMRRQHQAAVRDGGEDGGADVGAMLDALEPVLHALEQALVTLEMDQPPPIIDGEAATQRIDRAMADVIAPLVDRRGELMARHGSVRFVRYFSPLSSGERSLARTWSALTDGHAVEARASLADARAWFAEARTRWDEVINDKA